MNNQQRAENAIAWIDRLDKTRVLQGVGCLGDSQQGYCCLGVAKKFIIKEDYIVEDTILNDNDANKLGLNDGGGSRSLNLNLQCLAELNDTGESFNAISKILKNETNDFFLPKVAALINKHYA